MRSRRTILALLSGLVVVAGIGTFLLVRSPEPTARLIGPGGNAVTIPNTVPGKSYPTDAGGLCVKGGGTATILSVRTPSTGTDTRITGFSFYRDDPDVKGDDHEFGGRTVSIPCTSSDSEVHIMVNVARIGRMPEGRTHGYEVRYRLAGAVHIVDMGSSALLCQGKIEVAGGEDSCRT
jgi:hypothetical protein